MHQERLPPPLTGWPARLELAFGLQGGVTRLLSNRHSGPLRLIRALPDPDGSCQAVLIHPPGGLVNGDTLDIEISLAESSHVLCTTPGAQKWYRSGGMPARSSSLLRVAAGGLLEWLPHPAIVYDGARAEQQVSFELAGNARMIGWECLVLGRAAMGERFRRGSLRQRLSLRIDGKLAWVEQTRADADDRLFTSPLGWRGHCVSASVWAVGPGPQALLGEWREILQAFERRSEGLEAAATRLAPDLLLARLLADDAEAAMNAARELWRTARQALAGGSSRTPRIWAT